MESVSAEIRTEIMRQMREVVRDHLIDAKEWPASSETKNKFYSLCEELELERTTAFLDATPVFDAPFPKPEDMEVYRFTHLGLKCLVPVVAYLIGAHSVFEIPSMLVTVGLLEALEAEQFYSAEYENEVAAVRAVKELALKSYGRCADLKIETN